MFYSYVGTWCQGPLRIELRYHLLTYSLFLLIIIVFCSLLLIKFEN